MSEERIEKFNNALYGTESKTSGGYKAEATGSSAVGKYQHLWNIHGKPQKGQKISEIERVTGVKSEQEYLNNPQAQEKYQRHLISQYVANVSSLRSTFNVPETVPDEALMALQHFRGLEGSRVYLEALQRTGSYDEAQKAIDAYTLRKLRKRNPNATLPKNISVKRYLERILSETT
jgi:hypothetical protein